MMPKAMARSLLTLACLLLLRGPTSAQKPAPDPYAEEYKALMAAYQKAQQEYYAPYRNAKTEEERSKVVLDPKNLPDKSYFPHFQALARKAEGTRTAAQAYLVVSQLAPSANDRDAARKAYEALLSRYSSTPEAEQAVRSLRYAGQYIEPGAGEKLLKGIIEGPGKANLKPVALFTLGVHYLDQPGGSFAASAKTLLDRLKREYPSSQYAKQADGALFEMENLQIGKVAPEIEATDENGKSFKLSDYRGKVVVLDFWGWW